MLCITIASAYDPTPQTCSGIWGFSCSATCGSEGDNTFDTCSNCAGTDERINNVYINQTSADMLTSVGVQCEYFTSETTADELYVLYRNSTTASWKLLASATSSGSGGTIRNMSAITHTLDAVAGTHQFRCSIDFDGEADVCADGGSFRDNDDINITVLDANVPLITSINLTATSVFNATQDNLTCNYDLINGSTSTVAWYRNNTPIMLLYLPFEGNSSNALSDYSGHNNPAVGYNTSSNWNATAGHNGSGAFRFRATDTSTSISFASNAILTTFNETDVISLCAWIYPFSNDTGTYRGIVGKYDTSGNNRSVLLSKFDGNTQFSFIVNYGPTSAERVEVTSDSQFNRENWYHVCGVFNRTHAMMYVNAVLQADIEANSNGIYAGTAPFEIGTYNNRDATRFFNGTIDEVRIYNRSLTPEQVFALYQNRTNLIVAQETALNDVWQCHATGFNQFKASLTTSSNNLTISEIPTPAIANLVLNATSINIFSSDNLTCNYDLINMSTTTAVAWYKNTSPILKAYYPFEGNNSNAILDYSGNNLHGININAVWNATGRNNGNGSMFFNGNAYINTSSLINISGTEQRSISFWSKVSSSAGQQGLINWGVNGASDQFGISIRSAEWYFWSYGNDWDTNTVVVTGTWMHHVITYNGTYVRWYINNQELGSGIAKTLSTVNTHLTIGREIDNTSVFNYNGQLDNIRIYNFTLSSGQRKLLYENNTNIISSDETEQGDIWQCIVTPFHTVAKGESVASNLLSVETLIVSIDYPFDGQVFNRTFYDGFINVTTNINASCAINDTRFSLFSSDNVTHVFFNDTLKDNIENFSIEVNCTIIGDSSESADAVSFSTVARPVFVNITYPFNNTVFDHMTYNGTVRAETDVPATCSINDTRFILLSSDNITHVFFNNTINTTTQEINVLVNCTDLFLIETGLNGLTFGVDNEVPLIIFYAPVNNTFIAVNYSFLNATVIDLFLDAINISFYDSTGTIFYNNFTQYNQTEVNISINATDLSDQQYFFEICARDSLQFSPAIENMTSILHDGDNRISDRIRNAPIDRLKNPTVQSVAMIEMGDVSIIRTISLRSAQATDKNIRTGVFTDKNIWIDDGTHLKSAWEINRASVAVTDTFAVTYQCVAGCDDLLFLNDRGVNRIIDNNYKFYFRFDDAVAQGWTVNYQKQEKNKVSVLFNAPSIAFLDAQGSRVVIDPIMGGLNTVCENVTFFVDTTPPQITFANNSLLSGNYTNIDSIFVNFSIVEENIQRIDILTYYDNGSLFRNDSGNVAFMDIPVARGFTYHVNATVCDIVNQCASTTETRVYTVFNGNPDLYVFQEVTTQEAIIIFILSGMTFGFIVLSATITNIFSVGILAFGFFTSLYIYNTLNMGFGVFCFFITLLVFITMLFKK